MDNIVRIILFVLLCMLDIGCNRSSTPSKDVITKTILSTGISNTNMVVGRIGGCGCSESISEKIQPKEVEVLAIGQKQQGGPSDSGYWPVPARMSGRCQKGFRGCKWVEFEKRFEFQIYKNAYGEWESRISKVSGMRIR